LGQAALARLPSVVASRRADAVWLSKQLVVGIPSWEALLGPHVVLDVDDAMWLARPLGRVAARIAAERAGAVVVGNRFLFDWYRQFNANVQLVPTSIDTRRFAVKDHRASEPFVVGWTGSRATLPYLEAIEAGLLAFFDAAPDARLLVICDAPPRVGNALAAHVDYLPWSPQAEVEGLARMSVGIMPLADDEISRGKCSFKMLQYMASGLPVVVSPVGANADILELGELGWPARALEDWPSALRACWADAERAQRFGATGRLVVEREFSVAASVGKLERVIRAVAGR
jgi:glycosyltransferase involved in cell wall biosynthesis